MILFLLAFFFFFFWVHSAGAGVRTSPVDTTLYIRFIIQYILYFDVYGNQHSYHFVTK